ncbi:DUF262 domain-containing protein [Paludibacter jiangxiensis]|uniref:GmrSD restriction endonucleases N-terminal domain-containing protein n=1 Tax=Paludibacter jiangxiensis TaxID=681398 RepID=A0A170ZPJ7_9BACT|nr:DUF262 domain-containing protein [Paludibacter jiangxiensis]GAT62888.1 hypothetical protein PJIAN_3199 [Paludibacter jiangxiensis]
MENPRIRSISDLLKENFYVPRYQRGYRWGKQEITELLDDILQYYKATKDRKNKVSKFYCLQPVVVKSKTWIDSNGDTLNGWELIDGQQRLTSILLILNYLEDVRELLERGVDIYSIDFETRENCKTFFENKSYKSAIDESNVDFYHISKAYHYITKWFEKEKNKVGIVETLLNTDYNVSIIWYEALEGQENADNDSSIDLFTRLNEGKIPLTDAELIKALLLQADLYPSIEERYVKQRLFEIASEWDAIEATLQDEKMWLFLNNTDYNPSSKIDLIFKLLSDKWNKPDVNNDERLVKYEAKDGKPKHFEFLVFDKYLAKKREQYNLSAKPDKDILDPINEVWKEIKDVFSRFYDWYDNHTLFHYLGFLLAFEQDKEKLIKELFDLKLNKDDFELHLKKRIAKAIKITSKWSESGIVKELHEISYGEEDSEIRKILTFFNIETLIKHKKENARFPFHLFKIEKITSIEHIHPQNPESIDTSEERAITWLTSHKTSLVYFTLNGHPQKQEIKEQIGKIEDLLSNYDKESFKSIYSETIELYSKLIDFKENELHTLYNLALVDKDTNSMLNNSFFDVKRELLKTNKLGKYIPICTQRAFSKYYSENPKEMIFWNSDDRHAYYESIEKVYNSYIHLLN